MQRHSWEPQSRDVLSEEERIRWPTETVSRCRRCGLLRIVAPFDSGLTRWPRTWWLLDGKDVEYEGRDSHNTKTPACPPAVLYSVLEGHGRGRREIIITR
ncbi:MAG: hypothetical protein AB1941_16815 [Gemmatimonadota bacterium]